MARFLETIDLPAPCAEVFDFLVDCSTTARWDPSVVRARRLERGRLAPGSRFRVVVRALGVESELDYELVAAERPHRIVLRAERGALTSLDEISLAPRGNDTRVTYDARLTLAGAARLLDPLLEAWFQHSGARSAAGLRRAFVEPVKTPASSAPTRSGKRPGRRPRGTTLPASAG